MKAHVIKALLGIGVVLCTIGAPVFSALKECPSIRAAFDDGRSYFDFGPDVRLRLTPAQSGGEVALRGISAFEANESLYREINAGEAVNLQAVDPTVKRATLELFANNLGDTMEFVAVYHRENSAVVLTSFGGEPPRCERLDNRAAADFVADLTRSYKAVPATLKFVTSGQVYARLGL